MNKRTRNFLALHILLKREREREREQEQQENEARYGWRDYCEDGSEYGVDPDYYETEEEYEEALAAEKYRWREYCEDGWEYDIDPEDYETEEEYEEALEKAQYAWREDCEDGSEHDLDPEDYETEEEYEEALEDEKYAWRKNCEDGWEYDVDPDDYETEKEYEEALNEAKHAWREDCEDGSEYGLDPKNYETEEEYEEALEEAMYAWRKTCKDGSEYDLDPEDYETEKEYEADLKEMQKKYAWRKTCKDGWEYDVDPEDYETEKEYEADLKEEKYGWRENYIEDFLEYDLNPEDYETKAEYEDALDTAKEEKIIKKIRNGRNDNAAVPFFYRIKQDGKWMWLPPSSLYIIENKLKENVSIIAEDDRLYASCQHSKRLGRGFLFAWIGNEEKGFQGCNFSLDFLFLVIRNYPICGINRIRDIQIYETYGDIYEKRIECKEWFENAVCTGKQWIEKPVDMLPFFKSALKGNEIAIAFCRKYFIKSIQWSEQVNDVDLSSICYEGAQYLNKLGLYKVHEVQNYHFENTDDLRDLCNQEDSRIDRIIYGCIRCLTYLKDYFEEEVDPDISLLNLENRGEMVLRRECLLSIRQLQCLTYEEWIHIRAINKHFILELVDLTDELGYPMTIKEKIREKYPVRKKQDMLQANEQKFMVEKYNVITLCGSTRFKDTFMEVQKKLTLEGNIVISVGLFGHSGDDEVWEGKTKIMLDDMHKRKIDMADEIFVVNVGGYIGESTKSEIAYAESHGKKVRYLE